MKVLHPRGYESGLPRESSRPLVQGTVPGFKAVLCVRIFKKALLKMAIISHIPSRQTFTGEIKAFQNVPFRRVFLLQRCKGRMCGDSPVSYNLTSSGTQEEFVMEGLIGQK